MRGKLKLVCYCVYLLLFSIWIFVFFICVFCVYDVGLFYRKGENILFVCIVKMIRIICKSCNLLIGKIENFSGRYLNMCRIIYVKKKIIFCVVKFMCIVL